MSSSNHQFCGDIYIYMLVYEFQAVSVIKTTCQNLPMSCPSSMAGVKKRRGRTRLQQEPTWHQKKSPHLRWERVWRILGWPSLVRRSYLVIALTPSNSLPSYEWLPHFEIRNGCNQKLPPIHQLGRQCPTSPAPPRLAPLQEAGCQCDRWKYCKAAVKWPQAAVESPQRFKLYQKRPSLGVPGWAKLTRKWISHQFGSIWRGTPILQKEPQKTSHDHNHKNKPPHQRPLTLTTIRCGNSRPNKSCRIQDSPLPFELTPSLLLGDFLIGSQTKWPSQLVGQPLQYTVYQCKFLNKH